MSIFKREKTIYSGPLLSENDRERNAAIEEIFHKAKSKDKNALASLELALQQLGAAKGARYYLPSYGRGINFNPDNAAKAILSLAAKKTMLKNPDITQQLIIKSSPLQQQVFTSLQSYGKNAMLAYVLLGVHMQANMMLNDNSSR